MCWQLDRSLSLVGKSLLLASLACFAAPPRPSRQVCAACTYDSSGYRSGLYPRFCAQTRMAKGWMTGKTDYISPAFTWILCSKGLQHASNSGQDTQFTMQFFQALSLLSTLNAHTKGLPEPELPHSYTQRCLHRKRLLCRFQRRSGRLRESFVQGLDSELWSNVCIRLNLTPLRRKGTGFTSRGQDFFHLLGRSFGLASLQQTRNGPLPSVSLLPLQLNSINISLLVKALSIPALYDTKPKIPRKGAAVTGATWHDTERVAGYIRAVEPMLSTAYGPSHRDREQVFGAPIDSKIFERQSLPPDHQVKEKLKEDMGNIKAGLHVARPATDGETQAEAVWNRKSETGEGGFKSTQKNATSRKKSEATAKNEEKNDSEICGNQNRAKCIYTHTLTSAREIGRISLRQDLNGCNCC
ncbi:hypothetical protein EJ07DRAFT_157205 [Lizonia empirigonia]|nr:hypothetical protein EJ07DRAFT_157205 [Lizonia empirigonia]